MRRVVRLAVVGLMALAGAVAVAAAAGAHAALESSEPPSGSSLAEPPSEVVLTFTEPPDGALSSVEMLDAGGGSVPIGEVQQAGPRAVRVALPEDLGDGAYTVSWRVVSSADGHVTSGTVAFGVGTAAPSGEPTTAEVAGPSALSVGSKAALYAGLMLVVAVAGIGLGAFGGRPRSLHVVALVGAVLALAGSLGLLVAEQRTVGVPMSDLLESSTGRPFLWLVLAVLATAALAVAGAAKRSWRPVLCGAGAAATGTLLLRATGGHAAAADPALPQELAQWLHGTAAGLWVGGLALLWLLVRESVDEPPVREARKYSAVALVAVAIVIVTGVLRALEELGGLGAILEGTYGRLLTLKVVGAATLVAIGAVNRRRSIPRLATDPRPIRRLVTVELAVAAGVVLLTATLTGTSPTQAAKTGREPPASVVAAGSDFATTTRIELTGAPGTPGPATLEARVLDPDDGTPIPVDEVALRLRSVTHPDLPAAEVDLVEQQGRWTATTSSISLAGTWSITAIVRAGSEATQVPLVLVTRAEDATQTADIGPGLPTITTTTFGDGSSLQTYVDPAEPGTNQIHATAFDADGAELPVEDLAIVAIADGGEARRLDVMRLSPGHGAANAELTAGEWTFDAVATTPDGAVLQATWETSVEEETP